MAVCLISIYTNLIITSCLFKFIITRGISACGILLNICGQHNGKRENIQDQGGVLWNYWHWLSCRYMVDIRLQSRH